MVHIQRKFQNCERFFAIDDRAGRDAEDGVDELGDVGAERIAADAGFGEGGVELETSWCFQTCA